jgi:hypothetical protein
MNTPFTNSTSTFNRPGGTASPFQSTPNNIGGFNNNVSTSPFAINSTPLGRTSPVTSNSFYNQSPQNNATPFSNVNTSMTSNMGGSPFSPNGMSSPLGSPFGNNNNNFSSAQGQSTFSQPSIGRTPFSQQSTFSQPSGFGQTSAMGGQENRSAMGSGFGQSSSLSASSSFGQRTVLGNSSMFNQGNIQGGGFGGTSTTLFRR